MEKDVVSWAALEELVGALAERVRRAGGVPTTAVLHYKPERSKVPEVPDHHVVTTDRWVVYPFKGGA